MCEIPFVPALTFSLGLFFSAFWSLLVGISCTMLAIGMIEYVGSR